MGFWSRVVRTLAGFVSVVRDAPSILADFLSAVSDRFFELLRPARGEAIRHVDARDMRRLTGPFDSYFWNSTVKMGDVAGTDLGHLFDMNGKLYMTCGDSFGAGSVLPPDDKPKPRLHWRSNTMIVIDDWHHLWLNGLNHAHMITSAPGFAKELIPGAHQANDGAGEVTKIPTNGIAVDGRMFLHYMSVKHWGDPGKWSTNYSALAFSDDGGQNWHPYDVLNGVPAVSAVVWPGTSNFAQVAFVREGSYVYLFGIPAGRFGDVKLARVRATKHALLQPSAYKYFRREGTKVSWVASEAEATTIASPQVGELSVMYNEFLRRWIMLHASPKVDAIVVREAPLLEGPWSSEKFVFKGGYGSFMHPFLVENKGEVVYFTMSRWFELPGDNNPYNIYLMKARFTKV